MTLPPWTRPADAPHQSPLRLAIVCNSLPPYRRHFHRRIVRELPHVQLHTICTHLDPRWPVLRDEGFDVVTPPTLAPLHTQARPGSAWRDWQTGGWIIDYLRQHRIDAVLVIGYNGPGLLRVMRWCSRHGRSCLMFSDSNVRGDLAGGAKSWIKQRWVRRVASWCDAMLVCGRMGRQYYHRYGVTDNRMFESPYEPDYAQITDLDPAQLADAAARFTLPPNRRRLVFSGRLVPTKRVDLALDAFAQVAEDRPAWDLMIVGDGPLRRELEQRVPATLRDRVRWLGFIDDQATISAVYRLSDVLVLPSDYEPWALVVNEAAAADLAILASDAVGAAIELVRDAENGRVFPAGNLDAMIAAMREVTDPTTIDRLKRGSAAILAAWRRDADPVTGLKQALDFARIKVDQAAAR